MEVDTPSSGAARHLLPPGEKEETVSETHNSFPSPLVGEGARRAGEGGASSPNKRLKSYSRSLRKNQTEPEKLLWRLLRNRRFANYKFRRQVPLGSYIVDFICFQPKLIVELDGSQHAENAKDSVRDAWLRGQGFRVLRIWNNDLVHRKTSALDAIWQAVSTPEEE